MRFSSIVTAVLALVAPLTSAHAADACRGLDWRQGLQPIAKRTLTAGDLVRLRDIGPTGDDNPPSHIMAISPDGKWLAFQLRQADPDANRYCLAMIIQPLDNRESARFVDTGGDFALAPDGVPTVPVTAIGIAAVVTPRWSPDSTWFAFLKRVDGVNQVWRAALVAGQSRAVTPKNLNVEDFRVVGAGRIVVRLTGVAATPNDESLVGYHYDERFVPMRSSIPIVPKAVARYVSFDVATGVQRDADSAEVALFEPRGTSDDSLFGQRCNFSRSARGSGLLSPTQIDMRCRGAPTISCRAEACENSYGPVWTAGKDVRFLRREGWARMTSAIYQWTPGTDRLQRLYATDDVLADCQPARSDELICLRETSLRPRHLVAIDLTRGHVREILNPNPEFEHLALGGVERIKLKSSFGIPAFADVVLPTDYRPGQRYPLVVVQYQTRGFLRGGIGDEFPIQLFANNGFAVLSIQRPAPAGGVEDATDAIDIDRRNLVGFADRRNVLSVIETGVDTLIARGIVDPVSVGITGLSDGSSTVQFASLNSSKFAAGIVSGCCWEPAQDAWVGPAFAKRFDAIGWPNLIANAPSFWARMSLIANAEHVRFPLLFQAADDEFRAAVESVTALREAGKPADLFVFPDEYHIKWQPAHRLAVYERDLDWFMFWLRDLEPSDPRRRAEVKRWMMMKSPPLH